MAYEYDRSGYLKSLLNQKKLLNYSGNNVVNPTISNDAETNARMLTDMEQSGEIPTYKEEEKDNTFDGIMKKTNGVINGIANSFGEGVVGGIEGIADFGATLIGKMAGNQQMIDWAEYDISAKYREFFDAYGINPAIQWLPNLIAGVDNKQFYSDYINRFGDLWKTWSADESISFKEDKEKYYNKLNDDSWTKNSVYNFGAGLAQSFGQMLPSIAIGTIAGGLGAGAGVVEVAQLGSFALGAGGNTVEEELQNGTDAGKALAYGAIKGGIEAGTELFVGKALGGIAKKMGFTNAGAILAENDFNGFGLAKEVFTKKTSKEIANRIALQAFEEGMEEVVSDWLDPYARLVVGKEQEYKAYKKLDEWTGKENPNGYLGYAEMIQERAISFASGAVMGAMTTGTAVALQNHRVSTIEKNIGKDGLEVVKALYGNEKLQEKYNEIKAKNGNLTTEEILAQIGDKTAQEAYDNMANAIEILDKMAKNNPEQAKKVLQFLADGNKALVEWEKEEAVNDYREMVKTRAGATFLQRYVSDVASNYGAKAEVVNAEQMKILTGKINVNAFIKGNKMYVLDKNEKVINEMIAHELMSHSLLDQNVEVRNNLLSVLEQNKAFMAEFNKWQKANGNTDLNAYKNSSQETQNSEKLATMLEFISENKASELDKMLKVASKSRLANMLYNMYNKLKARKNQDKATTFARKQVVKALKNLQVNTARYKNILNGVKAQEKAMASVGNNEYNNSKETEGNKYGEEFRELQEESRERISEADWGSQSKEIDETLRARLQRILRERVERGRGSNGNNARLLELGKFNIYENIDAQTFRDCFEIARTYLPNGELVDLHDIKDSEEHGTGYENCTNYLSEDGMSGFAITNDGDLISVFNASEKRGWLRSIYPVINEKAFTLDCYMSNKQNLQEMYSKVFGWKTASIMDWNETYNHDMIGETHNEPKVAFMVNTNADVETKYFNKDQYGDAYDYRQSYLGQTTKYSLNENGLTETEDSDGEEVSDKMLEFMKDTKFTEDGKLLRLYHGSDNAGFMIFDSESGVYFFTPDYEVATTYTRSSNPVYTHKFNSIDELLNWWYEYDHEEMQGFEDADILLAKDVKKIINEYIEQWEETANKFNDYRKNIALKKIKEFKEAKYVVMNGEDIEYGFKDIEDFNRKNILGNMQQIKNVDATIDEDTDNKYSDFYDEDAETQNDETNNIYQVYVNSTNPLVIDCRGANFLNVRYRGNYMQTDEIAKMVKADGKYDGIIFRNIRDYGQNTTYNGTTDVYVAFESNQIKSVDNENPTNDSDIRYSLGYHAGDLGKSEQLGRQTGSRGTGHFGTGTYFVGDEAEINGYNDYQYGRGKAPHHAVEFDNYNLYRPTSYENGLQLHSLLKEVNEGYKSYNSNQRAIKLAKRLGNLIENYELYGHLLELNSEQRTKYAEILNEYRDYYGDELIPTDRGLEDWDYYDNDLDITAELKDIEIFSDEYSKLKEKIFKDYDKANEMFTNTIEEIVDKYDYRWSESENLAEKLSDNMNLPIEKINDALSAMLEYAKENNSSNNPKGDSYSTVFMKSLGYEGIDVRGLGRLDSTAFGSVIYNLNNDTVKYSLSGKGKNPNNTQLKENYLNWNNREMITNKKSKEVVSGIVSELEDALNQRYGIRGIRYDFKIDTKKMQQGIFNSNFNKKSLNDVINAILDTKVTMNLVDVGTKTTMPLRDLGVDAVNQLSALLENVVNENSQSTKLTKLKDAWMQKLSDLTSEVIEQKMITNQVNKLNKSLQRLSDYRNNVSWLDLKDVVNRTLSLIAKPFMNLKYNNKTSTYNTRDFALALNELIDNYNESNLTQQLIENGINGKTDLKPVVEYDADFGRLLQEIKNSIETQITAKGLEYKKMNSNTMKLIDMAVNKIIEMKKRADSGTLTIASSNARATLDVLDEKYFKNNRKGEITEVNTKNKFLFDKWIGQNWQTIRSMLGNSRLSEILVTDMARAFSNSQLYEGNVKTKIKDKIKELKIGRKLSKTYKFKAFNQYGTEFRVSGDMLVNLYISLHTSSNRQAIIESGALFLDEKSNKPRDLIGADVSWVDKATAWFENEENFSKELKEYATFLKDLMNNEIKSDYIEWYREKFGTEPNDIDDYWSLIREHDRATNVTKATRQISIFDRAKSRTNTKDAIRITDATAVVTAYAKGLAQEKYVMPVYNEAIDTLNAPSNNYNDTLIYFLKRRLGDKHTQFIMDYLGACVGLNEVGKENNVWNVMQTGFVLKSLSFNVGSMVKQISSLFTSNLPIYKSFHGIFNRVFGSKEFKQEFRWFCDNIGSIKYRSGQVLQGEANANGLVSGFQWLAQKGMAGITLMDKLTIQLGLSTVMVMAKQSGLDYGTAEFREFVMENWEDFRLTQVGNSILSQNNLSKSNGVFKLLFGVMQGANRACYASFRNKIQSFNRNFKVKEETIKKFLDNVDEEIQTKKDAYDKAVNEYNDLAEQKKTNPDIDLEYALNKKYKAQNEYNEIQAKKTEYEAKLKDYNRYKLMGGKLIGINAISGLLTQAVLVALINELVKHIKGKKDWDDWFSDEKIFVEMALNAIVSWIPVVNTFVNAIANGYDIEVGGTAIISDAVDIGQNLLEITKKSINGDSTKSEQRKLIYQILDTASSFTGLNYQTFGGYITGMIGAFDPEKAIEMRNLVYNWSTNTQIKTFKEHTEKGNITSAQRELYIILNKDRVSTSHTVSNELTKLYSNGYNALPKTYMTSYTDADGNKIQLTEVQIRNFQNIYNQSNKAVEDLMKITDYRTATQEEKAKMIKKIYDAYYSYAKSVTLNQGKADSKLATLMMYTNNGIDVSKFVGVLNKISNITDTKLKSRKELVIQYVNRLQGYSKQEKLLILQLAGYSTSDANNNILKAYLRQKGLSNDSIKTYLG